MIALLCGSSPKFIPGGALQHTDDIFFTRVDTNLAVPHRPKGLSGSRVIELETSVPSDDAPAKFTGSYGSVQ